MLCCVLAWQHAAGCCQAAASADSQLPAPPAPARTRLLRLRALRTHPCGLVAQGWEVDKGWSSTSICRAFNAHVRTCVSVIYSVRVPPSFSLGICSLTGQPTHVHITHKNQLTRV